MDHAARLQFLRLPAEAQRAALWRLALSGLTAEQISERTGCPIEQIRRAVDAGVALPAMPWPTPTAHKLQSRRMSADSLVLQNLA
jgi:hypothetical protein